MSKIIADYLFESFGYEETEVTDGLFKLLEPIMDDNYDSGYEDGYNDGYNEGTNNAEF